MEKPTRLLAVHRIVGGVEVQYQFLRHHLQASDELLQQYLVEPPRRRPVGPLLEPAQRRGTGQRPITLHHRLQPDLPAQRVVIVQILIPQRHRVDTLAHQRAHIVSTAFATTWVGQRLGHRLRQTQIPVGLA